MVGWHDQLGGHDLETALGVGDGQGGLAWPDAVHGFPKSWKGLSD